jgi:hypothetical protein
VKATDTSGLSVTDTFSAMIVGTPVVADATANQTWTEGNTISLTLPANTFTDPQGEKLTYAATQSGGQALPSWLTFNAATETFGGTAPSTAQSLGIKVTATDSSGLMASESFIANVQPAPQVITPPLRQPAWPGISVTAQTPNQAWNDGQPVNLALPSNTFTDSLSLRMSFAAYEVSGPNVTSWLYFDPATDDLFGKVPATASGTVQIAVVATDSWFMQAVDLFNVTLAPASGHAPSAVQVPTYGSVAAFNPSTPGVLAFHS